MNMAFDVIDIRAVYKLSERDAAVIRFNDPTDTRLKNRSGKKVQIPQLVD